MKKRVVELDWLLDLLEKAVEQSDNDLSELELNPENLDVMGISMTQKFIEGGRYSLNELLKSLKNNENAFPIVKKADHLNKKKKKV